jgi:hypothetical protein
MSYPIKRSGRILALALGTIALAAGPAHAKGALANPYDCKPDGKLAQSFAAFGDTALYTPVANAGVEKGAANWTLSGGAAVVGGNEPWFIGGAADRFSLRLPAGSQAVTAPICIDPTYPYFRLFARGAGSLKIEVLAYDTKGKLLKIAPYTHTAATAAWRVTPSIPITVFDYKKASVAAAPVAFRFTPQGAELAIDDVYVDPWARH